MPRQTELWLENYINGEFSTTEHYMDSFDPSTGSPWAFVPDSDKTHVHKAVNAAKQAFKSWSVRPLAERCAIVARLADLLESQLDTFAAAESRDQGKPVWLAKAVDIPRAVLNLRFFSATMPHQMEMSNYMDSAKALNYTMRRPVGVAGLIVPWNLPLYLLTFKLAPAIVAGNTVVIKPSEFTSVTAWMLCKLFKEAGLPEGVVNMVFGTGPSVGNSLVSHPDVRIISFTGSTATADRIRSACAGMTKKISLELGGKNPGIVLGDVDVDRCIPEAVRASFTNQGEICLCISRWYVHESIYDTFVNKFVQATVEMTVGDPSLPETRCGALVSKEHLAKVRSYVNIAHEEATVLCGDGVDELKLPEHNTQGYFLRPTVVTKVTDTSRLMKEEIFGPVVCIVPFSDTDEVVERANDTAYGLCAVIFGNDVTTVHSVAHKLEVATVWCNTWLLRDLHMPFGGTKDSGVGRESAHDSLEFYTEVKTVCLKL